ncbi:MAG: hypothetical protein K1X94_33595 [Sandaracinaceae bacterium]|nr:hypothetical protein [Sandaracinaceae bacterium]
MPFLEDAGASAAKDGEVAATDAALDGGSKAGFQKVQSTLAPTGAARFTVEGLSIDAPSGSVVVAALARDVDGDGLKDVVAWTQPPGGGGGELRFHKGSSSGLLPGRAVTGTTAGADVSLPAPCLAKPSPTMLVLVGPHSVALDLRPNCGDGAPAARRMLFAAFAPTPSIRWSARLGEPPDGFQVNLEIDASDTDGDGIDDPEIKLALEGGGAPWEPGDKVLARLPYWDRPAGLSRDRKFPEASFQSIAAQALARSGKKGSPGGALSLVRRLRVLHGALCAEGGAPWLELGGERGVACGPSKALEDAGLAEIKASLAGNDLLVALAVRERLASASFARTKKTRDEIDKLLDSATTASWGTMREPKVPPHTPNKGAPAWGALAFEPSGKLLVRTTTGVFRVDPTTLDERDADDVPSWPWEVALPGKDARLSSVLDPCDAPHLAARVAGHDVPTGAALLALPLLPVTSQGRCSGGGGTFAAVPVAWGPSGLYTLVAHEPVWIPATVVTDSGARASGTIPPPNAPVQGPFVQGAPRSPNGSFLVVPSRFGLVRRDDSAGGRSTYVRVKELEGLYPSLKECAIADGGQRIACVRENKVVIVDLASAGATPAPSASAEDG